MLILGSDEDDVTLIMSESLLSNTIGFFNLNAFFLNILLISIFLLFSSCELLLLLVQCKSVIVGIFDFSNIGFLDFERNFGDFNPIFDLETLFNIGLLDFERNFGDFNPIFDFETLFKVYLISNEDILL